MKRFLLAILILVLWPLTAWGTGAFITAPKFTAWDSNGDPLSGGKVYTYECGTTTPKTTYSNRALSSENANPVVLDSRGEADIYQSGCLKIVLKTSADVTIYTVDNFAGVGESFIQDADGDTLINVEESADEDTVRFDCGGTEQVTISDGYIKPTTTNDIELGDNSYRMKNIHTNRISGHAFPGFLQRPKFTWLTKLAYDGGTLDFSVGETVTGGTSGATGVVFGLSTTSVTASGTLYLITRNATAFDDDEDITSAAGAAVASGADVKGAAIGISPFIYYHCGTTEQLLYSDTNLLYEPANYAASDWSYFYFDDSAIVTAATNLISISQITDSTDEPAYSVSKHGWYHQTTVTNDMCFFAVLTDGGSVALEFFHDGGDYVLFADAIADITAQDVDNSYADAESALSIPSFSTKANVTFLANTGGDTAGALGWRTNGQTASTGHYVLYQDNSMSIYSSTDVITDSNQLIELIYGGGDSTNTISGYTNGWYLPNGM